jgi:hypothetical protein
VLLGHGIAKIPRFCPVSPPRRFFPNLHLVDNQGLAQRGKGLPQKTGRKMSRLAAKKAVRPNFFHFCISANWGSKTLLPSVYKGFWGVKNAFFGLYFIRTVRSRFLKGMIK